MYRVCFQVSVAQFPSLTDITVTTDTIILSWDGSWDAVADGVAWTEFTVEVDGSQVGGNRPISLLNSGSGSVVIDSGLSPGVQYTIVLKSVADPVEELATFTPRTSKLTI